MKWVNRFLIVAAICLFGISILVFSVPVPKTAAELQKEIDIETCISLGFPIQGLTVEQCVEIQELDRSTKELRRDLEELNTLIIPGFDI